MGHERSSGPQTSLPHRLHIAVLSGLLAGGLAACGGGSGSAKTADATADQTAPTLLGLSASAINATGQLTLQASASDNVGVSGYCFKTTDTTPEAGDACFTPAARSNFIAVTKTAQTWFVWARDAAGQVSAARSVVIEADPLSPTTPTVSVRVQASNRTATLTASSIDATSGVAAYCFKPDAALPATPATPPAASDSCFDSSPRRVVDLSASAQPYKVWAKDHAGNISAAASTFAGCSASAYDAASRSSLPVVCMSTQLGEIVFELEASKAPITVENFLRYVREDFYANTVFHRIMKDFMVQGGSVRPGSSAEVTPPYPTIVLESTQQTGLSNVRGALAMARQTAPDTASSGFFVNVVSNTANGGGATNLDYQSSASPGYAVFGRVIGGMDTTIESIRQQPVSDQLATNPPLVDWAYRIK